MPDKSYTKCDKRCLRCWRNKMKHGNNISSGDGEYPVYGERRESESKSYIKYCNRPKLRHKDGTPNYELLSKELDVLTVYDVSKKYKERIFDIRKWARVFNK